MTDYLNTRVDGKKFTKTEFNAIPRNPDGDIIDIEDAYPFITLNQRLLLSEDDFSRMYDLDEDMRVMLAEFE